ncbi:MAG: cyclodeaminase/cyclohydrolase family protein [Clostridiales Family XIII bacterium]|jgi:formiminotetrahydrofolate cyclodeaminase|nr:cyclodeaminase/cyclohydrolase family protein [Clostridiales Family XIII bacterium]
MERNKVYMTLIQKEVSEFVFELSSRNPIPGGGGASALAGALGASLGGMVANLTIGKPNYADEEDEMKRLKVATYRVQKELLDLIQKDADAFGPLAGSYRMPAETEEERASKARVMEASFKEACLVPLSMMKLCAEAITLLERLAEIGNRLALSDAACGAVLSAAAMRSAWLNVVVNTVSITDDSFASRVNDEGEALMREYLPRAEQIFENIEQTYRRDDVRPARDIE